MIVVPYQPEHLAQLKAQPAQADLSAFVSPAYAEWLLRMGPAYTVMGADGPLGIAGLAEEWEGRVQAWALLSSGMRQHMGALTGSVRRFLALSGYRRIEAQTPEGFAEGRRWLHMLGFEEEGVMRNYYPDGHAIRFARTT